MHTVNNRTYQVTQIDAPLLAADLVARGLEAAYYTLTGKRGGTLVCFRGIKSGQFIPAF